MGHKRSCLDGTGQNYPLRGSLELWLSSWRIERESQWPQSLSAFLGICQEIAGPVS